MNFLLFTEVLLLRLWDRYRRPNGVTSEQKINLFFVCALWLAILYIYSFFQLSARRVCSNTKNMNFNFFFHHHMLLYGVCYAISNTVNVKSEFFSLCCFHLHWPVGFDLISSQGWCLGYATDIENVCSSYPTWSDGYDNIENMYKVRATNMLKNRLLALWTCEDGVDCRRIVELEKQKFLWTWKTFYARRVKVKMFCPFVFSLFYFVETCWSVLSAKCKFLYVFYWASAIYYVVFLGAGTFTVMRVPSACDGSELCMSIDGPRANSPTPGDPTWQWEWIKE